jgi:hypothetical protein
MKLTKTQTEVHMQTDMMLELPRKDMIQLFTKLYCMELVEAHLKKKYYTPLTRSQYDGYHAKAKRKAVLKITPEP